MSLRKIADLQLGDRVYALGKNGNYRLVDESGVDAWGNKIATEIPLIELIHLDMVQALIDALGEAVEKIKSMELARARVMGEGKE